MSDAPTGDNPLHRLRLGAAIPAHPLALTGARRLDERRQRALTRYYIAAGVGGVAVGVHTTQFAIREPRIGLLRPVLELAAEEMDRAGAPLIRVGGICGRADQAVAEASLLRDLGYHAGLLSLAALAGEPTDRLVDHCRAVGAIIPLIGFYLQPAIGGAALPIEFWRRFMELPAVVAVKIAPFNRYQTLDVVRAAIESGRDDVALYTGNDDNIVADLLTPFALGPGSRRRRIVGGLLGHWSVDTREAVALHSACRALDPLATPAGALLERGAQVTDANSAYFDASHGFAGCIAGLHEVLRRQGLLAGIWTLDEREGMSAGQCDEISRVRRDYPDLCDDHFIAEHRDDWLSG